MPEQIEMRLMLSPALAAQVELMAAELEIPAHTFCALAIADFLVTHGATVSMSDVLATKP